ncbi:hypothetical protein [Emticicia sp. TH156]|uniref:hypothetical protein n=1 Tax=Emticicia sp. TH156 TaxID=2067454 RepID=UPI000C77FC38|nr:hypothetical protein [Emticicia sp. TH156]PLK46399.1 hypothetical protein C0V77_03385 [Emticicia sp. TH156]
MKKTILLIAVAAISTFTLLSCGSEDLFLVNPNGAKEPMQTCTVTEMKQVDGEDSVIVKLSYNSKNLLVSQLTGNKGFRFEYDDKDRIVKLTSNEGDEETIKYEYDGKGNISKAVYDLKGKMVSMHSEFIYTTNANGQVDKITLVTEEEEETPGGGNGGEEGDDDDGGNDDGGNNGGGEGEGGGDEGGDTGGDNGEDTGGDEGDGGDSGGDDSGEDDGNEGGEDDGGGRKGLRKKTKKTTNVDFFIEYDAKNNIKKISIENEGKRIPLLENGSFDDKPNVQSNPSLAKAFFPYIIQGVFFGGDYTMYFNANNSLSSKVVVIIGDLVEEIKYTYKYEYTKNGYPSKMKATVLAPKEVPQESEQIFSYSCK